MPARSSCLSCQFVPEGTDVALENKLYTSLHSRLNHVVWCLVFIQPNNLLSLSASLFLLLFLLFTHECTSVFSILVYLDWVCPSISICLYFSVSSLLFFAELLHGFMFMPLFNCDSPSVLTGFVCVCTCVHVHVFPVLVQVLLGEVNAGLSTTQVVVKELKVSASVQDQMHFLEEAQPYRYMLSVIRFLSFCQVVTQMFTEVL